LAEDDAVPQKYFIDLEDFVGGHKNEEYYYDGNENEE